MISYLKKIIKKNQDDIIFALIITLIITISFGAGLLTASFLQKKPLSIEYHQKAKNSSQINSSQKVNKIAEESIVNQNKKKNIIIIGNIKTKKYHWPWCPWAKKISQKNRIQFNSIKKAKEAGYKPCKNFKKLTPKD